jgi:hypothetical protein
MFYEKADKALHWPIAPAVAEKLASAEQHRASLESEIASVALDAALERPGAAAKLSALEKQITVARDKCSQLSAASRLAQQRDSRVEAQAVAKARLAQVATMQRHADARLKAMEEFSRSIKPAAEAYARFLIETDNMANAAPTGILQQTIIWDLLETMLEGQVWPASVDVIASGEMYRHSAAMKARALMPGAKPPIDKLRGQPEAIEPIAEGVKRLNDYLISLFRDQIEAIERDALERIEQGNFTKEGNSNGHDRE